MIIFDLPFYFVVFRTVTDRLAKSHITLKYEGGVVLQRAGLLRKEGYVGSSVGIATD